MPECPVSSAPVRALANVMRSAGLSAGLLIATGAAAETGPRVITDTTEYCGTLAVRLANLPAAELEPSRSLGAEGVKLCGNGHVRTGVAKLRRALRAAQAPSPGISP